jgi:hypothetical protein
LRSSGGECHPPSGAILRGILAEMTRLPGRHLSMRLGLTRGNAVRLRSVYRVQVSNMITAPFDEIRVSAANTRASSAPNGVTHFNSLLTRNSRRISLRAHIAASDANLSLPPPRHLARTIKRRLVPSCEGICLQ